MYRIKQMLLQKKVLKKYGIDWESPDKLNHIEYED